MGEKTQLPFNHTVSVMCSIGKGHPLQSKCCCTFLFKGIKSHIISSNAEKLFLTTEVYDTVINPI